jgi:hypothetical protein
VVNKTFSKQNVVFKLVSSEGNLNLVGKKGIEVESQQMQKGSFFIEIPGSDRTSVSKEIEIEVTTNGVVTDRLKTRFFYLPVGIKPETDSGKETKDSD